MELKHKLMNNWVEFDMGGRPNSNLLQFIEIDDRILRFEVQYVFDRSEDDVVNLGIDVPQELFKKMFDDIETRGYATLEIENKNSSLFSEWRILDGDLEVRLSFSGITLAGPIRYKMPEFKKLLI